MSETISLQQALQAQQALRDAADLPPEQFPLAAFVGMISDEVEALRERGRCDEEIAELIRTHSNIPISAAQIAEHYATPDRRQHP